jgi:acyl-CoA synthetase (AMP-forming)/AMP-acid ligase II
MTAQPELARVAFTDLARHGDRPAVLTADGAVTYRELAALVEDVAARLGTERRLVVLAAGNCLDSLVGYLAALSAGHPLLLAPADKPEALASLVAAYDPDALLWPGDGAGVPMLQERRAGSRHTLHPELALLLSTSGSTGSPKLVRLSHTNLTANAEAIAEYLHIGPDDRAATTLPLHYCYGLSVVNSHLTRGAGLVLTDLSGTRAPRHSPRCPTPSICWNGWGSRTRTCHSCATSPRLAAGWRRRRSAPGPKPGSAAAGISL